MVLIRDVYNFLEKGTIGVRFCFHLMKQAEDTLRGRWRGGHWVCWDGRYNKPPSRKPWPLRKGSSLAMVQPPQPSRLRGRDEYTSRPRRFAVSLLSLSHCHPGLHKPKQNPLHQILARAVLSLSLALTPGKPGTRVECTSACYVHRRAMKTLPPPPPPMSIVRPWSSSQRTKRGERVKDDG